MAEDWTARGALAGVDSEIRGGRAPAAPKRTGRRGAQR